VHSAEFIYEGNIFESYPESQRPKPIPGALVKQMEFMSKMVRKGNFDVGVEKSIPEMVDCSAKFTFEFTRERGAVLLLTNVIISTIENKHLQTVVDFLEKRKRDKVSKFPTVVVTAYHTCEAFNYLFRAQSDKASKIVVGLKADIAPQLPGFSVESGWLIQGDHTNHQAGGMVHPARYFAFAQGDS